jgi:hypothetical protein
MAVIMWHAVSHAALLVVSAGAALMAAMCGQTKIIVTVLRWYWYSIPQNLLVSTIQYHFHLNTVLY